MSIVLQGSTSGSITLQEPAVAGSTTLNLPASSGNVVIDSATQTLTNKTLTSPTITGANISSMSSSVITSGTSVASTSGTSIDFTSIPSWVKRITVMFSGVSTNGTSINMIQIGSGSFTTTGYSSVASSVGSSTSNTTGFILSFDQASNYSRFGSVQLCSMGSNLWTISGVTGDNGSLGASTRMFLCAGSITISGSLDRVRITTVNGTDTFDAGTINILYE